MDTKNMSGQPSDQTEVLEQVTKTDAAVTKPRRKKKALTIEDIQQALKKSLMSTDIISPDKLASEYALIEFRRDKKGRVESATIYYDIEALVIVALLAVDLARIMKTKFIIAEPIYVENRDEGELFIHRISTDNIDVFDLSADSMTVDYTTNTEWFEKTHPYYEYLNQMRLSEQSNIKAVSP